MLKDTQNPEYSFVLTSKQSETSRSNQCKLDVYKRQGVWCAVCSTKPSAGGKLKNKFFNREICVCAHLTQTRHVQKACAEMSGKIKWMHSENGGWYKPLTFTEESQRLTARQLDVYKRQDLRGSKRIVAYKLCKCCVRWHFFIGIASKSMSFPPWP